MLTTMAMGQRWLVCWILAVVPAVPNGAVSTLLDVPFDSVLWWTVGVRCLRLRPYTSRCWFSSCGSATSCPALAPRSALLR